MDFAKTTLCQRTRSCYNKLYSEFYEKKGSKRVRKRPGDDGNREEEKTGKSSEGLKKGKSEIDGGSGKTKRGIKRKKNLGKVSNKGKNVKQVELIDDSENEDEDEDYDDDKEFVIEEKKVKRGRSSRSFENVSQNSLIDELDDDDDDDVKLSKKCERKQIKSDVEWVSGSGKSKKKFVKDSGAAANRYCLRGKKGSMEKVGGEI